VKLGSRTQLEERLRLPAGVMSSSPGVVAGVAAGSEEDPRMSIREMERPLPGPGPNILALVI
jgi:hypothetical protein